MSCFAHSPRGFTLMELLVSIAMASLLILVSLTLFLKQSAAMQAETQRDLAGQEARLAYDIMSRLLRQAEVSTLRIRYGEGPNPNPRATPAIQDDAITIDFLVPAGYPIWPNDIAPYRNNAIRLSWSSQAGEGQYTIRYATAPFLNALDGAPLVELAGGRGLSRPRIVNLDLWPLASDGFTLESSVQAPAQGGYHLNVTTRTALPDVTFVNPSISDPNDPLRHHRTYVASGTITPRN